MQLVSTLKVMIVSAMLTAAAVAASEAERPPAGSAPPPRYAEEQFQGIVREVNVGERYLEVSGWVFQIEADLKVTIRGSHGAPSMLQEGMRVEVWFRQLDDGRLALRVDQLPDNQEIPEH